VSTFTEHLVARYSTGSLVLDLHVLGRVVYDTFEKYRQYRYRLKKVSSIPISISNLKSIANTDTFVYDFSTTGDIFAVLHTLCMVKLFNYYESE
jgi:hypothetical protein